MQFPSFQPTVGPCRLLRAARQLAISIVLLQPAPAMAQGLLDQLFGIGAAKPQPSIAVRPPQARGSATAADIFPQDRLPPTAPNAGDGQGSTYRTVCVRLCDGFFVPMSFATRRENFQLDQAKCSATCGGDARLFFHRNPGAAIEDATDMTGHAYSRLPNAFKFRKTRVEGCACRPPPWSETELARHQSYAAASTVPLPASPGRAATSIKLAAADRAPANPAKPVAATLSQAAKLTSRTRQPPAQPNGQMVALPRTKPAGPSKTLVAARTSSPASGLFGFGPTSGMGLGTKPKYLWPGD